MRYGHWIYVRAKRLLVVLLSLVIYTFLLVLDGVRFFPREMQHHILTRFSWLEYGFPSFVALMFLAIGILIWLYVSDRGIARLLFSYTCAATLTFAVQPGAILADPLLSSIGDVGASLTLFLFAILLLFFPARIHVQKPSQKSQSANAKAPTSFRSRMILLTLLRTYIGFLAVLCVVGFMGDIVVNEFSGAVSAGFSGFLEFFHNFYALVVLISIIATIIISYRRTPTLRERQQRRIFVGGVILATAPLLLLTVIPALLNQAFGLSPHYIINPQLSTVTVGLFPLALGYSILRYQFLVFDMYIQRAVSWLIGCVGLLMGCYAVITGSSMLFSQNASTYAIFMVFLVALVAPLVWWLGKVITARVFFSEMAHYQRMINRADVLTDEKVDLDEAARLLTLATVNTFATQEVCLFVLDEETGYFCLTPQEIEGAHKTINTVHQQRLLERLTQAVQQPYHASSDRISNDDPIIGRLEKAKRPLFLREVLMRENELPTGLGRFLMSGDDLDSTEPLLVPVKYQGILIGMLVLGQRADQQQYAGPDFEAMYLLVARFASVIETARLYVHASRHVAVLDALYSADTKSFQAFETVEDAAKFYAQIAANATEAAAEILLYNVYSGRDHKEGQLDHIIHIGNGPRLIATNSLKLTGESDWLAWFYQGSSSSAWHGPSNDVPGCLPTTPCYPFAWLPLLKGEKRIGVLVLTYARPHIFSQEEQRVMSIFASQCVAGLENVRIAIELRAAYERQKELDNLKDQFIMTASHELRTPLTAVQGYIELLNDYDASLSPQARADFIAKAHRSCDELALMVGNIMDASRVRVDVENTLLDTVSLLDSVKHVLEILEAIVRREKRTIRVDIPDTIYVFADSLRLRQILLNIISNALKYSPAGTDIEIHAAIGDDTTGTRDMTDMVTVSIRDYGFGVPSQFKEHLFERFVRLERDMNSPIRGVGLGLAICKQLVEAMGGKIGVESSGVSGEGSTFIFTLKQGTLEEKMNLLARARQGV